MNYRREIQNLGYTVVRGSFVGTTDDRIDRWYLEHPDDHPWVDRRGPGYNTLRDAYAAVNDAGCEGDGDREKYYENQKDAYYSHAE